MRKLACLVSFCAIVTASSAADAKVLGSAVSDTAGKGTIQFSVDPNLDPQKAAEEIGDNVALTNGADVKSVEVKNCQATVEFANGPVDKKVLAEIPDEVATRLGECTPAGAAAGGGTSVAAIAGGAAVVAGGIAAGVVLSGNDSEKPVGRIAPPPVVPPVAPPPSVRPPVGPPPVQPAPVVPPVGGGQPPPSRFR